MITLEELKEAIHYEPNTGIFTWLNNMRGHVKAGDTPKSKDKDGYLFVMFKKKCYRQHRLAWFYMTGEFPNGEIDHINNNPADNRFENLRVVTRDQNQQNKKVAQKNNKCGYLGVNKSSPNRWRAAIYLDKKRYHLGYFITPEEAHEAYLKAKREMHSHCTI